MRESVFVLPGGKRRFCPATRRSGSLAELLDIKNTSIILHFTNVVGMLNRGQVAGALCAMQVTDETRLSIRLVNRPWRTLQE